jgi:hypothetical protein
VTAQGHAAWMDELFSTIAARAAAFHGVVSAADLVTAGVNRELRDTWLSRGLMRRTGPRSFVVAGAPATWHRALAVATIDLGGRGFLAGRTGAQLHGLDGFDGNHVEALVPRSHRDIVVAATLASTALPLDRSSTVLIDGLRCLTAERLILDAPLFGFTKREVENAIDSAIRLKKLSEQRLRTRAIGRHSRGVNGSRILLEALVDGGGESRLERWALSLIRRAGLPPPALQVVHRDGTRIVARVDMQFGRDLVVEFAGHGTHSARHQRQVDEQRRTELTLRGVRVLTFTYDDVRDRPDWVVRQLQIAVAQRPAA